MPPTKKRKPASQENNTEEEETPFDPLLHCRTCKEKAAGKEWKKPHHQKCPRSKKFKAKSMDPEERRLQQLRKPPTFSSKNLPKRGEGEAATRLFFEPRPSKKKTMEPTPQPNMVLPDQVNSSMDGIKFCQEVQSKLEDPDWCKKAKDSCRAPAAMAAFAKVVEDTIIKDKKWKSFNGLTITVPACEEMYNNPQYHSIVGQDLLFVDWIQLYGLEVNCPCCNGTLKNTRNAFSRNKSLFPIFGLDGPLRRSIKAKHWEQ